MVSESLQKRNGGCHCGAVKFTVTLPTELRGARCDCSICAIKGVVMVGAPLEALEVVEGEDVLSCYQFNTRIAKHWFCSRCGIHCFHQRRSEPSQYGINAACLDGVSPYYDFPDLPVFDGVRHAKDSSGRVRIAGRLKFEPTPPE